MFDAWIRVGLLFLDGEIGFLDGLAVDPLHFKGLQVIPYLLIFEDFLNLVAFLHLPHDIQEQFAHPQQLNLYTTLPFHSSFNWASFNTHSRFILNRTEHTNSPKKGGSASASPVLDEGARGNEFLNPFWQTREKVSAIIRYNGISLIF